MGFFFFFNDIFLSHSYLPVSLSLLPLIFSLTSLPSLFLSLTPHNLLSSSFPFSFSFLPPFLSVPHTVLSAGKMAHSQLPTECLTNPMLEITVVREKTAGVRRLNNLPTWLWAEFEWSRRGLPWWSSGWDSLLPMQGAWVWSLVEELDPACHSKGCHMPQWRSKIPSAAT